MKIIFLGTNGWYTSLEKRSIAQEKARAIFPNTTAAKDDMVINL